MGDFLSRKDIFKDKKHQLYYSTLVHNNMKFMKKIHELSIVKRINDALGYVPDMKKVCCSIIDTVRDEINIKYCSLMILDRKRNCLRLKALWSPKESKPIFYEKDSPHYRFQLDEGIAGKVATGGVPILVNDVSMDDRFIAIQNRGRGIKSLLCMPLRAGDEIVGVLNLSHQDANAFNQDDKHLINMITNQIAIALKNVYLFNKMQKLNDSLEKRVKDRTKELEDINDMLMRTRDQLVHSEKIAALGTLAGGVAHEFNNLLCMMQGYAELAEKKNDIEMFQKATKVVLNASERGKTIAQNLLSFSRRTESKNDLANLVEAMEETLTLVERDIEKDNIKIVRKYSDVPDIVCDVSLIQQVLLNMIINARHAMQEDGGTLSVSIYRDKEYAVIEISDTGKGIKKEIQEKIFEPFFTTKGVWGDDEVPGTGLGLSVSLGVIQSHNGKIELDSGDGKGTTFKIKLPLLVTNKNIGVTAKSSKKITKTDSPKALASVLVVDDEEVIRDLLCEMLRLSGHKVKIVSDGNTAIKLCRKESYDIVFVDIMMPGLNGVDTVRRIQKINDNTKLAFITGLNLDNKSKLKFDISGHECIKKPFKLSEINEVIAKLMA